MKDEHDNRTGDLLNTKSAEKTSRNAKNQQAFRARQKAAGKRQTVIWIVPADWREGYRAGDAGEPATPVPPDTDPLSWFGGWIEGDATRKKRNG